MNDKGKTIKTIFQRKSGYVVVRHKHRCVELTFRLELADDIASTGTIGLLMDAVSAVAERATQAIADEFLP